MENLTIKLISIFLVLVLIVAAVVAVIVERKHRKKHHKEMEQEINREAFDTIQEAKMRLREDITEENIYMSEALNQHTIRELVTLEPTAEDYVDFVNLVGDRVKELYEQFQFALFEPAEGDLISGYFMQFQIFGQEEIHNELFVHAMDKGIDTEEANEYFFDKLKAGEVLPLGDNIQLERDGTGISPVKTGDDIRIIVSFVTDEYKEKQDEANADE